MKKLFKCENIKEFIKKVKYDVKHNKINKLNFGTSTDTIYKYSESYESFTIINKNSNQIKYLQKNIYYYIYKYGYSYKTIKKTCELIIFTAFIQQIIGRTYYKLESSFFNDYKMEYRRNIYTESGIAYMIHLKNKKSKLYLIIY